MVRSHTRSVGFLLLVLAVLPLSAQRGSRGGAATIVDLIIQGTVLLPDETISERLIRVDRVCGTGPDSAVYADSRGKFRFDLGPFSADPGTATSASSVDAIKGANAAKGCSIRASLAGYHPQTVALGPLPVNEGLVNPGKLILQPLGKDTAPLLSATGAAASKNVRQSYEKGLDEAALAKWPPAIAAFQKATSASSKFAAAWLDLGIAQSQNKEPEAGMKSFSQAIAADSKFAPPYVELAAQEAVAGQWAKVIEHTNQAIALAPDSFAAAYYLNAMANIRLGQSEAVRKSVAEGLRVDEDHEMPDLEFMDGVLLLQQGDKDGARKRFQSYLVLAPAGINAANARQFLGLPARK